MSDIVDAIEAFDIEGWLSLHGNCRSSGIDNATVNPCPVCGSTKRKFYINVGNGPQRGRWLSHCCHDQGNLVRLVQTVEGFAESIEARVFIRYHAAEAPARPVQGRDAAQAPQLAMSLPEPLYGAESGASIIHRGKAITLADRLLTDEVIRRYGIKVTGAETLFRGERRRDLDHRLVIPILAPDGALLAWQARDLTGRSAKKYVFPSGASATNTFFGWRQDETGSSGWVLIVEGVFQKLAWDRLGVGFTRNTVASFGKKLTERQVDLLVSQPGLKKVYLAWDLDAVPQMCQHAVRLYGRKKVFFVPPPASGLDHDEVEPGELVSLMGAAIEATPGQIALLSARAAMGHFTKRAV